MKERHSIEERLTRLSLEERRLLFFKMQQLLAAKPVGFSSKKSNFLVAYVVANSRFHTDNLKSTLKSKVPEYMVPSKIVMMDKLPVLPNGKVDRNALGKLAEFSKKKEYQPNKNAKPTNDTERQLLTIWQKVLNISNIGIYDNFFEIGGDSILSIQVIAQAKSYGIILSPNQLFEHQTIKELADFFEVKNDLKNKRINFGEFDHLVPIQPNGDKPPLFFLHSGGSHFFFYNLCASYIDAQRPVFALQASRHEGEITIHKSVHEMAVDFVSELKKVYPKGPYHFVSYCFNTAIGVEIVKIFDNSSDAVNLIIADTMADYLSLFARSRTKLRIFAFYHNLKKQPIKVLRHFALKRIIRPFLNRLKNILSRGGETIIQKLHNNHLRIYRDYDWQPIQHRIHLLLTEKRDANFNEKIINSWEKVAKKGVNVVATEGNHDNLFSATTVSTTARNIEGCMQDFENAHQSISKYK